jgi:cellulose synthase (UDP-forming)
MKRIINYLVFFSPFIAALIATYLTLSDMWLVWLAYGVWLAMFSGFFVFLNYTLVTLRYSKYDTRYVAKPLNLRIAAFVTSFNEDPAIIKDTLLSVNAALKGRGDVYLLDDSTKPEIVKEMEEFCRANGIYYIHRTDRRGFKAGAINNALRLVGDKYNLVAIFDADQRPTSGFFDAVLPFFRDENVAFVQVPQKYTETDSYVSQGAKFQQEPFLRIIMRGRSGSSAFSLGSGTVFRTSILKEVGGMDESSITEDVATSLRVHSRTYPSPYLDEELIWYGEPPPDASSYVQQQSRWSFGYFQLTLNLLKMSLDVQVFFDYAAGFYYWLKEGLLTFFEMVAPIVFLLFRRPYIKLDPFLYAIVYFPYLFFSTAIFTYSIRRKIYGLRGFLLHQFVEYIAFFGLTVSFFSWLARRKRPFKVTPKGKGRRAFGAIVPPILFDVLLLLSIFAGFVWYPLASKILQAAILVNLFWSAWHYFFLTGSIIVSLSVPRERGKEKYVEKINK